MIVNYGLKAINKRRFGDIDASYDKDAAFRAAKRAELKEELEI